MLTYLDSTIQRYHNVITVFSSHCVDHFISISVWDNFPKCPIPLNFYSVSNGKAGENSTLLQAVLIYSEIRLLYVDFLLDDFV